MRAETGKFIKTAAGAYSALLGLSYIEKYNNESLAREKGEEKFDYAFYTAKDTELYWENHNSFITLTGKIMNGLLTEEREHLVELIQRRQDSIVLKDGSEEGYNVSRSLLNALSPYITTTDTFNPVDSTVVSVACLLGMGIEASKKTEDSFINQEYVGIPTEREVVYTNAIINDEGGSYIEGFAKHIVEDDKKLFPEGTHFSSFNSILTQAHAMDDCQ